MDSKHTIDIAHAHRGIETKTDQSNEMLAPLMEVRWSIGYCTRNNYSTGKFYIAVTDEHFKLGLVSLGTWK